MDRLQHLPRPAPVRDVEEQGAGSVRYVGRQLSGKAEADKILGEKKVRHALEGSGFVIANPQELGRAESGEGGVGNVLNKPFRPHPAGDPIALRLAALIAPNQGRAKKPPSSVEQYDAVHLAGKTDGGDVRAGKAELARGRRESRSRPLSTNPPGLAPPTPAWACGSPLDPRLPHPPRDRLDEPPRRACPRFPHRFPSCRA